MKKTRLLAWLLIVAMLSLACPAFGEETEVELYDAADGALSVELEAEDVALDDAGEDLEEIDLDLSGLELSDELSVSPADEADGSLAANGGGDEALSGHYQPQGGPDNDTLFAGYVDMLFGRKDALGLKPNGFAGDRLTGGAALAYDYLLKQIEKIAAGTLSSTKITIPKSVLSASEAKAAFQSMNSIINALLVDCPYHLFWYDKTQGTHYSISNGVLTAEFVVTSEYASGTYTTNATKIKSAQVAVTNAKNVVKKYAGASDYDKLCGYRDYICGAVEYNDDAAATWSSYDMNAWQLIWVFDGNSSTNVVCEGYAKAFQYLCDLSSFNTAIQSHIVTGDAGDAYGSGPHMWNIVTMGDGKNYHVDVTFIDSGFKSFFLAGATYQSDDRRFYVIANEVGYQMDSETLGVYPSKTLMLATSAYKPGSPETPAPQPTGGDVAPTSISIAEGKSATLYMGNTLPLTAVLTPGNAKATLTWSSDKKSIATVNKNGVVTPKKAGKAVITVKAGKLSAKITVKVVDASGVSIKYGGKKLKKGAKINVARGGTLTLDGVVSPAKVKSKLTWSSGNKSVTVKNGVVTVKKNAKAGKKVKITVKTANKKSTYIYIVVK